MKKVRLIITYNDGTIDVYDPLKAERFYIINDILIYSVETEYFIYDIGNFDNVKSREYEIFEEND